MKLKLQSHDDAGSASSLIELLGDIPASKSVSEIAESAARLTVETLGAAAAIVVDGPDPIGSYPPNLRPEFVAELCGGWDGSTRGPSTRSARGLVTTRTSLPTATPIGIISGWAPAINPRSDDLALVATVADARIHQATGHRMGPGKGRALAPRPEQSQLMVESVPAAVYIAEIGDQGKWVYVSPQIESILGYTPEEWTADPELWYDSIHPDDREYPHVFEDERLIGLDIHWPAEYRLRTKNGQYIWIHDEARLIKSGDEPPHWFGFLQDITRRKAAEARSRTQNEQQLLIASIGEMAIKGETPSALIRMAADSIAELDGVVETTVFEQNSLERINLRYRSGGRGGTDEYEYASDRFPGEQLVAGKVLMIPDWFADKRLEPFLELLPSDIRSSILISISGTRQQFGLLAISSDQPGRFTAQDASFLRAISSVLGNAIERHRADDLLRHRLEHDPLTGLPNRELFTKHLNSAMEKARARGGLTGLLFLDVDHFKVINDGIGHHAGDELLRKLSEVLTAGVREGDTVARFGGDEFSVVLAKVKDREDATEAATRLLEDISRPIFIEGSERYITASVGVALYSPGSGGAKTAEDLIREADAAMYRAKELGREQIQVYGRPIRDRAIRRLEVERELHVALDNRQLTVVYQPVVSLRTGRISAFEALVRWNHPEKGLLRPAEFVPIAESTDLITQIDSWVLGEAARQAGLWNRERTDGSVITVSANASARQIANPRLPGLVADLLEEHHLLPEYIALEITETVLVDSTTNSEISRVLDQLDRLGIRLALDDFGTGFSSLAYLSEFPLYGIKIDRAFVRRLVRGDPKGSAIANAMVHIGRALSLVVIAEAVTEESDLDKVRELGCHAAQGRYFAGPGTAEEATALLLDQPPWLEKRKA
ncbi:MAG: EAL domain-containing protein [Thermoleophilia bacterium]|nr:EAL domain-containing protein [Thermoleophilia bacterium]